MQQSLALAFVRGEAIQELPSDLFIPPDALEVFLEIFTGPLDFLLYLIKQNKLDIIELSLTQVTNQYLEYVDRLKGVNEDLLSDYLVMAATLAELKSRLLLPKAEIDEIDLENDPRLDLLLRLKAYETMKSAALEIDNLPRLDRDFVLAKVNVADEIKDMQQFEKVELDEVISAFMDVLKRLDAKKDHLVEKEKLSLKDRIADVLKQLSYSSYTKFNQLFTFDEGKAGVVISFLALMELVKAGLIELVQTEALSDIYVRRRHEQN